MELIMNAILKFLIFTFLIFCFSCEDTTCYTCEENGWLINCQECISELPMEATLKISLSGIEAPVLITVYEGELEDSVEYKSALSGGTVYNFQVKMNKKYTVTAEYQIDGKIYIAVDTATPRVKYTKDQCEEPCYFVYDRKIDLRLKYTAN
ncbi:MAG TPA: hypothetical protein DEO60_16100 [Bacteroidales bacterium]|nr:hypothetical protein [Bacteroidales bacterium]